MSNINSVLFLFLLLFSSQAMSQKMVDFQSDVSARKMRIGSYFKSQVPCSLQLDTFLGDTKILTLYNDAKNIEGSFFCKNSLKEMASYAYTSEYCQNVNACADSQTFTELSMAMGTRLHLQKLVSNEYVQQELSKKIEEMERMQLMMDFAKKKYGEKFSSICPEKFEDSLNDSTCSERINQVFSDEQKDCKPMSPSCYAIERSGVEGFNSYVKKTSIIEKNKFSSYFSMRINTQENFMSSNDDPKIQNILSRLTGPESNEEKIKNFYDTIYALESMGTLDPILGYFPLGFSSDKKDELKKRLDGFVQNVLKKKLSLKEVNSNFHALRLKLANDLADDHCTLSPSYESLCVDTENILSGKKAPMNIVDARKRLDEELLSPGNKLKAVSDLYISGGNRKYDPTESAQLLLESMRCKSFDFEFSAFKKPANINKKVLDDSAPNYMLPIGSHMFVLTHRMDNKSQILLARQKASENEKAVSEYHIRRIEGSSGGMDSERRERKERKFLSENNSGSLKDVLKANLNDSVVKTDNLKIQNKTDKSDQSATEKKMDKSSDFNNLKTFKNDFLRNPENDLSRFGQGAFIEPEKNAGEEKAISEKEEADRKDAENNKLKEVSDKISSAQEKLKKELKKPQELERDEENKNQIQSLSKEVENLKNQLAKPEEVTIDAPVPKNEEKKSSADSRINHSGSEKEVSSSEKRTQSQNTSLPEVDRSKIAVPKDSSTGTAGISNESVPVKTESSTPIKETVSDKNTVTGYRLVLSSSDGISLEQKEASIVSKILENNGAAFEILEDGVPVKIIPLIEKGKIVYEDGKPKFRKELIKMKNPSVRAPSQEPAKKIESKGGQYQKLKSLTDSIIKSQ